MIRRAIQTEEQIDVEPKTFLHRFQNLHINPVETGTGQPEYLSNLSLRAKEALALRARLKGQFDLGKKLQRNAMWIAVDRLVLSPFVVQR